MVLIFIVNSILLGAGLAMDAFSVSLANGLNESGMNKGRMCKIAGVFAAFQTAMPLAGWVCVHTIVTIFTELEKYIPWTAFILLAFIGGKMVIEGIGNRSCESEEVRLGGGALLVQGIATSIDALSVGFAIADYKAVPAVVSAIIIGVVTFVICMCGLLIGKKFGTRFAGKATVFGGVILIIIGLEILLTGIL